MSANKLTGRYLHFKLSAKVKAPLLLGLPSPIGDENVRYLDPICILAVQDLHSLDSLWDRLTPSDQDAVYIESKGIPVRES